MQFEVTILGSNGAISAFDRYPSAQVLSYNGNLFLIDCGEGTQFRMNKFGIKRGRLDNIFISHLHGDHFFGLIGLLVSFNLSSMANIAHEVSIPDTTANTTVLPSFSQASATWKNSAGVS